MDTEAAAASRLFPVATREQTSACGNARLSS